MKKSITLIEIIFSIVILSIILIISTNIILDLNKKSNNQKELLIQKIEFESIRLFLNHKIKNDINLDKLSYKDKTIYYDNNILLKNVSSFSKITKQNYIQLNLIINNKIINTQEIIIHNNI